jgi:hypothetical protein
MEVVLDMASYAWRKSTRSSDAGANCVEVAPIVGQVLLRDSIDPDGSWLTLANESWAGFISALKQGSFDQPWRR